MQDIEALTERNSSDRQGADSARRTAVRASKPQLFPQNADCKLYGRPAAACEDIVIEEDKGGRAILSIDTGVLSVSEAIARLSAQTELRDVSVAEESIDELVASLYREFAI